MAENDIEVMDLGEEGEQWLVMNAADDDAARRAVVEHLREQGVLEEYEDARDDADSLACGGRDDWYWVPVSPEHPDEEAYLRSVKGHGENEHSAKGVFSAHLVTV